MEYIIAAMCAVVIVLLIVDIFRQKNSENDGLSDDIRREMQDSERMSREEMSKTVQSSVENLGRMLSENQKNSAAVQSQRLGEINNSITEKQQAMNETVLVQMKQLEQRMKSLESNNEQKLEAMRGTMSKQLLDIQTDNNKKLDEMRNTVDEKLQKTLESKMTESFKAVSERLEQVYKGLGEMQTIAAGVGDLKKVLSNVKTRGILGEIQLGAILEEILSPEQYETDVATVPNSTNRVEFAVKLPAQIAQDDGYIYLPIDSKFPGDTYYALQDAYEKGDAEEIKVAYTKLETVIKSCAKDIKEKYISPPYTTNFGIMFLPFEGLYAEVVNHGLVEELQNKYSVNVCGPSTMAAMLNSLQMGFKTLRIQQRSNEVWEILGAVKTEFDSFEKVFSSAKLRIRQLDEDMDKLIGTRTRAIQRKLRSVSELDKSDTADVLELDDKDRTE